MQRFGAALNLNVHVHALVLDGLFGLDATDAPVLHEAAPPSDEDVGRVIETVCKRAPPFIEETGEPRSVKRSGLVHVPESSPAFEEPC